MILHNADQQYAMCPISTVPPPPPPPPPLFAAHASSHLLLGHFIYPHTLIYVRENILSAKLSGISNLNGVERNLP